MHKSCRERARATCHKLLSINSLLSMTLYPHRLDMTLCLSASVVLLPGLGFLAKVIRCFLLSSAMLQLYGIDCEKLRCMERLASAEGGSVMQTNWNPAHGFGSSGPMWQNTAVDINAVRVQHDQARARARAA